MFKVAYLFDNFQLQSGQERGRQIAWREDAMNCSFSFEHTVLGRICETQVLDNLDMTRQCSIAVHYRRENGTVPICLYSMS